MNKKSIAGGVLGIIGAVFALLGTIGLALCAGLVDAVANAAGGSTNYEVITWVVGMIASAIGIVGAVMCFKKAIIGGILLFVSLAAMVVLGILVAFSILNIIAMVLLGVGGILAFVVKK